MLSTTTIIIPHEFTLFNIYSLKGVALKTLHYLLSSWRVGQLTRSPTQRASTLTAVC